jgi:hypothetical protein
MKQNVVKLKVVKPNVAKLYVAKQGKAKGTRQRSIVKLQTARQRAMCLQ